MKQIEILSNERFNFDINDRKSTEENLMNFILIPRIISIIQKALKNRHFRQKFSIDSSICVSNFPKNITNRKALRLFPQPVYEKPKNAMYKQLNGYNSRENSRKILTHSQL